MFHTFPFSCLCCCCLVGVFAGTDELKSVSVMEGDSVSLNSGLTEIQRGEKILWALGRNRDLIAETDGVKNTFNDRPDGRFRGRLKLDKKTGSLTIMNITTDHTGVYVLDISGISSSSTYRFTVTVYAATTMPDPVTSGDSSSSSLSSSSPSPPSSPSSSSSALPKYSPEGHAPCCDSVEAALRLVVTALMGVASAAAAVLLVNDVRAARG
ncbi:uncharacterized protein LOC120486637 isoform X2 [Pimephales promelas]|uniref:uncharacterized protein LOC120486637 isoform X2 n=1 Tax=Pimephales promelas TaxID=90988 RepID=UPI0019557AA8|nr:uncharacterized protein LOC120486637 isoform X2 [Pimephales promelas]